MKDNVSITPQDGRRVDDVRGRRDPELALRAFIRHAVVPALVDRFMSEFTIPRPHRASVTGKAEGRDGPQA